MASWDWPWLHSVRTNAADRNWLPRSESALPPVMMTLPSPRRDGNQTLLRRNRMSKTTRMMRTIVPTPMYMTFPLVTTKAGAQTRPANRPSHCPQSARPNPPAHPWLAMTRSEMKGPHDSHRAKLLVLARELVAGAAHAPKPTTNRSASAAT